MARDKLQKIKLLLLYDFLLRNSNEDNPCSTAQIISMLEKAGVSAGPRTIFDDVQTLIEYGYEIQYFKSKSYYYYVTDRAFDIPELKVLIDAVQAASFIPDDKTERLVSKIADLAGSHRAELLKKNIVCFDTVKHSNKYIFYSIDTLVTAIEQKKQASFVYYGINVNRSKVYRRGGEQYIVNPLALIYTNDKYYLVCYSDKYKVLANYRIDRMEKVGIEEAPITPVPEYEKFNVHTYKQQAFSMFTGELREVTLTVDVSCLDAIYDRFGEHVYLFDIKDNFLRLTVKVQVSHTFFGWCLTSCGKIRISAPADVVNEFKGYADTVIASL